jgi:very-short-patch-repair endonuclease
LRTTDSFGVRQTKRSAGGWLSGRVLDRLYERHRGRPGMKAFKVVTAAINPQTRRTRSELEDDFFALCRRYGLPTPISNTEIEGVEVDMHFSGTRLIVELDCYDYHRTPYEFDSDRRRDAYLKTKGYEILRVSDEWFNSDPGGVAATVAQLLAAKR